MSRCSQLVLSLFFAACEQSAPAQNPPVFPEAAPEPTPAPAPAPAPVAEARPEPAVEAKPVEAKPAPAVAPVKPKPRPTRTSPTPEPVPFDLVDDRPHPPGNGHWSPPSCRPGSRMACRWVPEADERGQTRVTKKDAR